jgi:hypothetical protein
LGAAERDEFLRAAWRTLVAGGIDQARLVFVDEMGANVSLSPLYAWSRRSQRAYAKTPRNRGKNVTLLASITAEGVGPCLAVEGPTTRGVFEAYLQRVLAPSLRPGQVVVLDNLSAHKGGRVREIVECRGCGLLYLHPYSPDFNPIEHRPSPRSRGSYDEPRCEPAERSWRRWVGRWTPCPSETPAGSSGTAATARWANRYDERSRPIGGRKARSDDRVRPRTEPLGPFSYPYSPNVLEKLSEKGSE